MSQTAMDTTGDEYATFGIIRLTTKKTKSASYFHGMYIICFEETIQSIEECMDAVLSLYPALQGKTVEYMIDDELAVIFDRSDANLQLQIAHLQNEYPDVDVFSIDSPALPIELTLDVLDTSGTVEHTCSMHSDRVTTLICPSEVGYDYNQFAVNYTVSSDLVTLVFFGGAIIEFR